MPVIVNGPNGAFMVLTNSDGFYVGAVGEQVNINGSPIIITFDGPVDPGTVDAGALYRMIQAKLNG